MTIDQKIGSSRPLQKKNKKRVDKFTESAESEFILMKGGH